MNADDGYAAEPPPEAYSRVTNPGRFRPLHAFALEMADRLAAGYDVARTEAFAPPPGVAPFEHARPPVTLTPSTPAAAPVAIAFTTFPGVIVRYGRWLAEPFPSCGCDACGETAGGEGARLEELLGDVVAGRFTEELTIPLLGEARLRWTLGGGGHRSAGMRRLPRARARTLRGAGPRRVRWQPWPPRMAPAV